MHRWLADALQLTGMTRTDDSDMVAFLGGSDHYILHRHLDLLPASRALWVPQVRQHGLEDSAHRVQLECFVCVRAVHRPGRMNLTRFTRYTGSLPLRLCSQYVWTHSHPYLASLTSSRQYTLAPAKLYNLFFEFILETGEWKFCQSSGTAYIMPSTLQSMPTPS